MIGVRVDPRRLMWLVLIGLALTAVLIPAVASASTKQSRVASATKHAAKHVSGTRHYREFGRKVGAAA